MSAEAPTPVPKVLVIANQGERNPSTRMRILQYIPELERRGFAFETFFVPYGRMSRPVTSIHHLAKAVRAADVVFVQRVLRRPVSAVLRRLNVPVIFDLDDATHYIRPAQFATAQAAQGSAKLRLTYRRLARGSEYFSSRNRLLKDMLDLASVVIVGNQWLLEDISATRSDLVMLPTAVSVDRSAIKQHGRADPVTIGWTGVPSNLFYLDLISDSLRELGARYGSGVRLSVVSSAAYRSDLLATHFVPWSLESERRALQAFDVGIMPLQDDPFSRGKCSFKAILCMSRGLPVVVSPVGANRELVEHGVNGFLAATRDEWTSCLGALVEDPGLRSQMGVNAVATIERSFSTDVVLKGLEDVLRSCVGFAGAPRQAMRPLSGEGDNPFQHD
jgi:glycosyltransferase involved in cell wall biosynthesis